MLNFLIRGELKLFMQEKLEEIYNYCSKILINHEQNDGKTLGTVNEVELLCY